MWHWLNFKRLNENVDVLVFCIRLKKKKEEKVGQIVFKTWWKTFVCLKLIHLIKMCFNKVITILLEKENGHYYCVSFYIKVTNSLSYVLRNYFKL